MTGRLCAGRAIGAILVALTACPALAQTPQPPQPPQAQPPLDPAQAAAKTAFERLDEAERKAIQNDLIWSGDFNGVASGEFGPRTFAAIRAFERRVNATVDGILAPAERAGLKQAADAARAGIRFANVTDQATGIAIGMPQAILTQRVAVDNGMVYRRADGQVSLQLQRFEGEPLAELFERLRRDAPNRKVTYRLQRPDWFVVSGEEGQRKFYTRIAQGPQGLRGYTFRYPVSEAAQMDRLMVAIANTFEPFPTVAVASPPARPSGGGAQPAGPAAPALVQPTIRTEPRFALSGVVVGNGRVLTSAAALRSCAEPSLGGQPIPTSAVAASGDLAVLSVATGQQPAIPLAAAAAERVFALSFDDAAQRVPMVASGMLVEGFVVAALQVGPGGAPIVDAEGRLVGMVRDNPRSVRMVAGVVPAARHAIVGHEALGQALAGMAPTGQARGVAGAAASLVEIRCARRI